MQNEAVDRSPLGKVYGPEHVAGTAVFLASDAASGVSGHIQPITGPAA